jgi:hypothetical protein
VSTAEEAVAGAAAFEDAEAARGAGCEECSSPMLPDARRDLWALFPELDDEAAFA